jgi:acetone carboxylase alpha subunit
MAAETNASTRRDGPEIPRPGIGQDGKTLEQMLAESRRLLSQTGCYAGITQPRVLREDPIQAELFHSRVLAALIAGRETTRMISGSPLVREVAELAIGLYTPEGDNIAQSTGIQAHILPMGGAIQWMIENDWEKRVGIQEGDLFWFNECSIAGMHPADVYDILPIFWEGELVAWVCTVIMEMDIGAVTPGVMPAANVERATDGVRFAGEKVGSGDRLRHDIELKCQLCFDMADVFLLDRKGAIAANIRVREEVRKLIEAFGLDYFRAASRELIEEERRNQIARIRQRTVPGVYRNVVPLEFYMADQPVSWLPAKKDHIRLVPIEMRIESSGSIVLDFEGAGEWGWHPFNATPSGLSGALSIALVQTLSYDGRANLGSLLPFEVHAPLGTLLNPENTRPLAQASIWAPALDIFGLWLGMLGHAYYVRGFREETFNYRSSSGITMAGYDQFGKRRPLLSAPTGTLGAGASGVCDGMDPGGMLPTPEVDLGNAEIWEMFVPRLDLGRRFDPSSVGHGRRRSGVCVPEMQMLHRSRQVVGAALVASGSYHIPANLGQLGGYPSGKNTVVVVQKIDVEGRLAAREPLVHRLGHPEHPDYEQLGGEVRIPHHMMEPFELRDGDIVMNLVAAGGGLGDPIEREPERVQHDLEQGLTTEEIARDIYCVEASPLPASHEWRIDEEATRRRREAKRRERLRRAVPVQEWWRRSRRRLLDGDLDPLLVEMYASSMKLSQRFAREFRDFWALPEDAGFEVQE